MKTTCFVCAVLLGLGCAEPSASEGQGGSNAGGGPSSSSTSTTTGAAGAPGTITTRGSGFGTKANPGPILFDDFESGAVGAKTENQRAVVGAWQTGAGSESPEYTDAVVRTGARACRNPFTASTYSASLAQNLPMEVAYLDYWTYVAPLDPLPDGFSRNWKPFRFYGANDDLQSGITTLNGGSSTRMYFLDLASGIDVGQWTDGFPVQAWFHIQAWIRLNDVGRANGTVQVRVDDVLAGVTGAELRAQEAPLDQLRIGHYWATDGVEQDWPHENSGANVYIDDVYFDTTWARVEIGDASNYDETRHREIQIVTAWSDTEVTFTYSQGTLRPGPAWVFVIGEDGTVLATEELLLGH